MHYASSRRHNGKALVWQIPTAEITEVQHRYSLRYIQAILVRVTAGEYVAASTRRPMRFMYMGVDLKIHACYLSCSAVGLSLLSLAWVGKYT